jgi:enoyl-CoA hydratase
LENAGGYPRLERAVMNALADETRRLATAPEFVGAVITGSERAFAVGADIQELAGVRAGEGFEFSRRGQEVMASIECSRKPVIAAIRGFCFGGGLDLALACRARIASPDASFAHPGGALGIITGWGGTQRLPRLVGRGRALEMFVTGGPIGADEAQAYGLISQIAPSEKLIGEALRQVHRIVPERLV